MKKWTKEEIEFLTDNYSEGATYCAEKLNRTVKSVYEKARSLKIKAGWYEGEIQFLINNYVEYGPAYCAEQLGRTYKAVQNKANRLNLKTDYLWTVQEEQFLIDNYAEHGPAYCANHLNNTYLAVRRKANRLNLQANTKYDGNIVYAVYFPDLFLYKVGITNNVDRRIKEFGRPCIILNAKEYETPQEAAEVERDLLSSVTRINTGELLNGNTETFTQPSEKIKEFLGKEFAYL